jgi:hypothetical protein
MGLTRLVQRLFLGAAVLAAIAGCEKENSVHKRPEYVAPETADIRGTWYEHGSSGGWYGPNDEWGFGWYYFTQYGTNIEGKFEFELYKQDKPYSTLRDVTGTVSGNDISLIVFDYDDTLDRTIDAAVNGNVIEGIEHVPAFDVPDYRNTNLPPLHIEAFDVDFRLERTSTKIERRATPW